MADPPKKLTFGFAKVVKKSNLIAPAAVPVEKKTIQLIDSLEGNKFNLKEGEQQDEVKEPLVIPMIGPRKSSTIPNGKSIAEIAEDFSDVGSETIKKEIKQEIIEDSGPIDSLEAMAARELLQEGADTVKEGPESTLESLPTTDNVDQEKLQKESTLEDYESIPVNQFGLAMLRGMGWKPDEGIGKSAKLVPVTAPTVRPKGMGLGADKVILAAKLAASGKKDEEELKMMKGAYVKVLGGMHKNHYAQVEGFADDSGRVVLKLAIGGHVVSVNEATVCLVSKSDYSKNSKVLNAAKFDEFKKKEETGKRSPSPEVEPRRKSPGSSQVSKKPSSSSDKYKDYSPKRERSFSPKHKLKKEKRVSRSCSRSPKRHSKKSSHKDHDSSQSPPRIKSRKNSPDEIRHGSSSMKRRSSSSSPDRNKRKKLSRRSKSSSNSPSREKYSHHKKYLADSDSDSKTYKKKKKSHKERKRTRSSSVSVSRSRSRSPKSKKKSKKSRRSRSRSPSRRKHR